MKFDGIHYYSADADPTLCKMADNLTKGCPHMQIYSTCQNCPKSAVCLKIWDHISGRSKMRQLKTDEIARYRRLFREKLGVAI